MRACSYVHETKEPILKRVIPLILRVVLLLVSAANAEWLSEPKPPHQAWEFAAMAPSDSMLVLAVSLEGHLDPGETSEAILNSTGEGIQQFLVGQLEGTLGRPIPDFLAGFTGNALIAVKMGEQPVVAGAVELRDPAVVDSLLAQFELEKEESADGYTFLQLDTGLWLARGQRWLVLASNVEQLRRVISSLDGGRALSTDSTFQEARASLNVSESALCFYADGSKLASGGAYLVGMSEEASSGFPALVKYAVFSLDPLSQRSDGFLAYSERRSALLDALRQPGRLRGTSARQLPQSAGMALMLDARWVRNAIAGLAQEFPQVEPLYTEINDELNSRSDFWKAYDGEFALATNLLDEVLPEMLGMNAEQPTMVVAALVTDPSEAYKDMVGIRNDHYVNPADECASNLKNIATGLEMYSTDWSGRYPPSTEYLVPNYLRTIPPCPAAGEDTYSKSYQTGPDAPLNDPAYQEYFYLECRGHNHLELQANRPRYNGITGLERGPEVEVFTQGAPPLIPGQAWEFHDDEGSVTLNSAHDVLKFAYGGQHREWADPERAPVELSPAMKEALDWGDGQLVYASHWDLTRLYGELTRTLSEEQKKQLVQTLTILGGDVENLRDTQCLKATPGGLRYRGRGFASTPAMGAGLVLTTAILVPNFMRARVSGQTNACESNLKNIGTGLEMWFTDHEGKYPESLSELTPDYLRFIPECPSAGMDTYSEGYVKDGDSYEVYCKGEHHLHTLGSPNHPRYTSEKGIVDP